MQGLIARRSSGVAVSCQKEAIVAACAISQKSLNCAPSERERGTAGAVQWAAGKGSKRMRVAVEGSDGVLGTCVRRRAAERGIDTSTEVDNADVAIRATPASAWGQPLAVPCVAPAVRQGDVAAADVTVAGFWGGLGSLLAGVAVDEARDAREVHVAYGFPGSRRLLSRVSPTLRQTLVRAATDPAVARVDGVQVPEPLGEGRRLAWFPRPVGPAHAVAVGGLEHRASLDVPTVRTWLAAGSMAAELLQAVGRWDVGRGPGAWLDRRAQQGGGGPGATNDVRWAVVVEVLDVDGGIVRAWANGTDPVRATADLLLEAAGRLAVHGPAPDVTVLGLGAPQAQLDALADLRTLRWSVSRPEPSHR